MASDCPHRAPFATTVGANSVASAAATGIVFDSGYLRLTHFPTKKASTKSKTMEMILMAASECAPPVRNAAAASRYRYETL